MELKEFITEVILHIREGIVKAESGNVGSVLPHPESARDSILHVSETVKENGRLTKIARMITNLEFEVALTESNSGSSSSGLGVFLGGVGVGAKGEKSKELTSLTKIKFTIPIKLS